MNEIVSVHGSERRNKAINQFLEQNNYDKVNYENAFGVTCFLIPNAEKKLRNEVKELIKTKEFRDLIARILRYQRNEVLNSGPNRHNEKRGDCFDVALKASVALFGDNPYDQDYGYIRIGTKNDKNPLPFTKDLNYGFHYVNYVEKKGIYMTYDLTSHYSVFKKGNRDMLLCVFAESLNELDKVLQRLYKTELPTI